MPDFPVPLQANAVTEWRFQTCLKYLVVPGSYLRGLALDVLFPNKQLDADTHLAWVSKRAPVEGYHRPLALLTPV
jgi:hypothetical protein